MSEGQSTVLVKVNPGQVEAVGWSQQSLVLAGCCSAAIRANILHFLRFAYDAQLLCLHCRALLTGYCPFSILQLHGYLPNKPSDGCAICAR